MTTIPLDKIDSILKKGKNLEEQLGKENTSEKFVELSKEYSENLSGDYNFFQVLVTNFGGDLEEASC